MLTKKQQLLLQFIHERMQAEGVPPSFEEMKQALDLKSKSGIHRLITALEERGFIRRLPNRARALEVIKMPESWGTGSAIAATNDAGNVITADFGNAASNEAVAAKTSGNVTPFPGAHAARDDARAANDDEVTPGISIPVMGKIAAGGPIDAIEHITHSVMVPPDMIGNGEHFALTIDGDSMIDAGIHNGDTVIIRHADTARGGEIVVALVDGETATLKTFRRDGQEIVLEAANPAHPDQRYDSSRVHVQGKLVGLIRQYH